MHIGLLFTMHLGYQRVSYVTISNSFTSNHLFLHVSGFGHQLDLEQRTFMTSRRSRDEYWIQTICSITSIPWTWWKLV